MCRDGKVKGIWKELPDELKGIKVYDYTGKIIFPGMCDLHMHAPQYAFRGLGMNLENPDWDMWFEKYAFPDEKRYEDCEYAKMAYERLTDDLLKTTTTRCVMFATIHRQSTEILMDLMEEKGIAAYVGKVNMDRNSIPGLLETTEESLEETKQWIADCEDKKKYRKCRPIITPRYIPTCTDELMSGLGDLIAEKKIPVQSHLSEGLDEMEWVRELKPELSFYGEGYDEYHMFGDTVPTVMAHCVYSPEEEIQLMKKRDKLIIAHCPQSNISSSGGIAPVKRYLAESGWDLEVIWPAVIRFLCCGQLPMPSMCRRHGGLLRSAGTILMRRRMFCLWRRHFILQPTGEKVCGSGLEALKRDTALTLWSWTIPGSATTVSEAAMSGRSG